MAKVNPYNPDIQSSQVGTAGVDQSAGQAQAELAQGAASLRQGMAQLSSINNADVMGQILGAGLRAVGGLIASHRRDVAQQKNMLANLGVTNDAHKFAQNAGEMLREEQANHVNDPENVEDAFNARLEADKKQRLSLYKDPVLRAKASNEFESHITTFKNKAANEALDAQTAQANALIPNLVAQAQASIAKQTGTPEQRMQNFADQWFLLQETANKTKPVLGDKIVDAHLDKAYRDLSDSFFQNQINERSSEPLPALKELNKTDMLLRGSVEKGFDLTVDDKNKLAGRIEAAKRDELKYLELNYTQQSSTKMFQWAVQKTNLHTQSENAEVNNNALQFVKDETARIDAWVKDQSKDLPIEAQDILHKAYAPQIKMLDEIGLTARANLRYQDGLLRAAEAQRKGEAAEARRIANEAKAEHNRFLSEQKTQAKDALTVSGDQVKAQINTKLNEIEVADPINDKAKIIKLNAEINNLASLGRQAGFIDSGYALERIEKANRIGEASTQLKQDSFFGLFPSVSKVKDPNEQLERSRAQQAAVSKLQGEMALHKVADTSIEEIPIAKRRDYIRVANGIISNEQMTASDKRLRLNQLRTKILGAP